MTEGSNVAIYLVVSSPYFFGLDCQNLQKRATAVTGQLAASTFSPQLKSTVKPRVT